MISISFSRMETKQINTNDLQQLKVINFHPPSYIILILKLFLFEAKEKKVTISIRNSFQQTFMSMVWLSTSERKLLWTTLAGGGMFIVGVGGHPGQKSPG